MDTGKPFMFVLRIKLEETRRGLLGYYLVAGDSRKLKILKCVAAVNYWSEKFLKSVDLTGSWQDFLLSIKKQYDSLNLELLMEISKGIQTQVEGSSPERVAKLVSIMTTVPDLNMKNIIIKQFVLEDLKEIFPTGKLKLEVLTELAYYEDDETGKQDSAPEAEPVVIPAGEEDSGQSRDHTDEKERHPEEGDNGAAGTSVKAEKAEKTGEQKPDKSSEAHGGENDEKEPGSNISETEKSGARDDTPPTPTGDRANTPTDEDEEDEDEKPAGPDLGSQVDLVVDPVDGVPAYRLKRGDIVLASRSSGFRTPAKVISVARKKDEPHLLMVTLNLSEGVNGHAETMRNALVYVETRKSARRTQNPSHAPLAISLAALSAVILFTYLFGKYVLSIF